MKWFVKTNIGDFDIEGDQKFLSANLVEADSIEDVLDWYKEQWSADDVQNVNNVIAYIFPWHPTTYKAHNDPETGEIIWEPY